MSVPKLDLSTMARAKRRAEQDALREPGVVVPAGLLWSMFIFGALFGGALIATGMIVAKAGGLW